MAARTDPRPRARRELLADNGGTDAADVINRSVLAARGRLSYRWQIVGPPFTIETIPIGAISLTEATELAARGRPPKRTATVGWAALTPTERAVVALVAEGATNIEVGRRLLMSPTTVKTHLSHIYTKVNVCNRAELATFAARLTLD